MSLNKNVVNMLYSVNGFGGEINELYEEIEVVEEHMFCYNLTETQIKENEEIIAKLEKEIDILTNKHGYNFRVLKTILENVDEETIVNGLTKVAKED